MDINDRMNLNFLLNSSDDVLKDWYSKVDEDDHKYAESLLTIASLEFIDEYMGTKDAEIVLAKYTL